MEENGWTAWVAGEGYDDLWDHETVAITKAKCSHLTLGGFALKTATPDVGNIGSSRARTQS